MNNPALEDDTRQPRRRLDKHQAVRHLIHAAIRLIEKREDPFAVQLLIHSADKILIDLAKNRGEELPVDWELYIKPEYRKAFFEKMRATYNYFKHTDTDFAENLPVHDIMTQNVMSLFLCTANYAKLFKEFTDHMKLFQIFVMHIWPQIMKPKVYATTDLLKNLRISRGMTPMRFFATFEENQHALPKYNAEMAQDLEDTIDFYNLSFAQLRRGETKSKRVFKIRE